MKILELFGGTSRSILGVIVKVLESFGGTPRSILGVIVKALESFGGTLEAVNTQFHFVLISRMQTVLLTSEWLLKKA